MAVMAFEHVRPIVCCFDAAEGWILNGERVFVSRFRNKIAPLYIPMKAYLLFSGSAEIDSGT